MNLVFICQKLSRKDQIVGFICSWIKELKKHTNLLVVLALKSSESFLSIKPIVFGRKNKLLTLLSLWKELFFILRRNKIDLVLSHLSPIFAISVSPLCFLFKTKNFLWYAHRKVTFLHRILPIFVDKIITSDKEACRIKSKKVFIVGQGVDTEKFKEKDINQIKKIISVGRISRIKNYETLIEAAKILKKEGFDFSFKIVGNVAVKKDISYLKELQDMIKKYKLSNVSIEACEYEKIESVYESADLLVNLCPDGAPDKVVFEASCCMLPILVCNKTFLRIFKDIKYNFYFEYKNPFDLASKIKSLCENIPPKEELKKQREITISGHSIKNLILNIIKSLKQP